MGLVAVADFGTGPEWSFGAIYMLPILGAAYFLTRRWVVALVLLSSLAWLVVDLLTRPGYSHPLVPYWNAWVRLVMFAVAGLLLHQVRALQARERALMQFVVHDLRNPLMALDLSLQRLGELHEGSESSPAFKTSKHLIRRSQGLLDSLLELARLEVAARPVDCRPFPLPPLLEEVLETFRFVLDHHRIHIRIEGEGADGVALGDPKLTERILENLLGNAIKASPSGKTITIAMAPPRDGYVQLSVRDQGGGVPESLRERVFEPFVQGRHDSGEAANGLGLGLSFCRAAMQAQNGRIWLECPPQGGTIVSIALPAAS